MTEDLRGLERKYVFANYPYADSAINQARLRQLGAVLAAAEAPAPTPPATISPNPPSEPTKKWGLPGLLIAAVIALIVYKNFIKPKQEPL
jgi:hypothetical protein